MKTQRFWTARALLATFAVGMTALPAFAQKEKEEDEKPAGKAWPPSAPVAKITPLQAMATAKKKLGGGTAFQANFEFDEGYGRERPPDLGGRGRPGVGQGALFGRGARRRRGEGVHRDAEQDRDGGRLTDRAEAEGSRRRGRE